MEVKIYFAVKVLCALFVFYHLWVFLFCRKIYGLWDKLHNWARITRVRLWKYRKKRIAEKAKRERRRKYTVRICLLISLSQSKQKHLRR